MPKSTKQLHKCESNSVELVKFTKNIGGVTCLHINADVCSRNTLDFLVEI